MAKKFRIFADVSAGSIFFDGGRVQPQPLGGKILASLNPNHSDRIRIVRTDLFGRDGVTPRRLFKGLKVGRVKNQANQILTTDLGFNVAQVIDYINDQANKKANEIDFQKDGALVGGGTTINFTGNVDSVSVNGDVTTVAISTGIHASQLSGVVATANLPITSLGGVNFVPGESDSTPAFDLSDAHSYPIGIQTSGGFVGSAITLFDFRGSGVSTVTSVSSGISTVFFEGGSAGNPVTSGIITGAGSTTLRLTLQDSTDVDIDVTTLRTTTAIGSSTNYFFLNNGAQLSNNDHDIDGGVTFYNQKLRRGEELVFSTPGNSTHVGIWNGGNGITGVNNVRNKANWSVKWQYNHPSKDWEASNNQFASTGVELNRDVTGNNGTYAIRFDYDTEKLQLWQISTAYDWLISSAASGVGSTDTFVFFSTGDGTNGTLLPSVSQIRSQEWTLESFNTTPRPGHSIYEGLEDDDVWKSTRSMRPGQKMKATIGDQTKLQYWGVGYGGTTGNGDGPTNPYSNATGSWRSNSSNVLKNEENSTLNQNYTAKNTGSSTLTLNLTGRNISWRYNSDNSWDMFDEDTEEVILSGDNSLDGGDMYPYLFGATEVTNYQSHIFQWDWEWNEGTWFMEYRDWSSGHNAATALSERNNTMPLKTATEVLDVSGGRRFLSQAYHRITWGEKLRPGQEFIWTNMEINQNGATKNNMIIGVLSSDFDAFDVGFRFDRFSNLKEQSAQDAGVTVQAGISTIATSGQSCRLKYDAGDNKLKLDVVRAGVRETMAVSNSALDGNPVFISMGGDSTRIPTSNTGVEVYGWEIAHEPPGYYNPWKNWRIGGFPENVSGLSVGVHSTGNVLAYAADQVWRHKDGIPQGYKMHWLLPTTQANTQIGQWSSSNASSGLTNVENVDTFWDWSWQTNTSEEIDALKGWTFNTSNSNYSSDKWTDPNPGSTKFSIRYHSNNTVDIFDESNSAIIATKDVNADGNPIYISWVAGGNTSNQAQMQDDFFGGGDVGIALTSATV